MRNPTIRLLGIFLLLIVASCTGFLLTGCTVVTYCPKDGPCVMVGDLHPAGGELDLLIRRADGTVVYATRGQPSSEEIITGIVDALNPAGGLLP